MQQIDLLIEAIAKMQNPSAVGLDTRLDFIPDYSPIDSEDPLEIQENACEQIFAFNKSILDCLSDIVPAVKIQIAYCEMLGLPGMELYKKCTEAAKDAGYIVITDAKRGDIGASSEAYADAFLRPAKLDNKKVTAFESDFLTVNPYFGTDGVQPFVDACESQGKGIFLLVKTSNPSGAEFQDLICEGKPLYAHVADKVVQWGSNSIGSHGYSSIGAVVGATYPAQSAELRKSMPNSYFLVPGYGAQGATAADLAACFDSKGQGAIVNASRSILCAHRKQKSMHYTDAARQEALRMKAELLNAVGGSIG